MPVALRPSFALFALLLCLCANVLAAKPLIPAGQPGTLVNTPPDLTYYALQGDTLSSIALRYTEKSSNAVLLGKRNKISNDRAIAVGTGILIPIELLPEEASQAQVAALAGNSTVQKKDGSQTPIALGDILTEGSQINTGNNGFLSLALPDQSRISIPSNSQVTLTKLRMTKYSKSPRTQIHLLQGRVESKVTPLESNKGRFEVTSPLAIAGVRGTHFRVGVNDNGIANEVLSGAVAVGKQEKPNSLLLPAGKGNLISSAAVGQAQDLLPPPLLSGNFSLQVKPTVQLEIQAMPQARAYRAQIAFDAQAQQILMEAQAAQPRFKFDGLADGNYFARVTAIDALGLEGLPSIQAFTLKARPEPPFSVQPKAKLRAETVDFVWTEAAEAQSYRLQIATDAAFQTLVLDQAGITAVQYRSSQLASGTYYWRLASVTQRKGKIDQGPFGDTQVFSLLPTQGMHAPLDTGENKLSLNWPSEPGQKFLLQIARDASFNSLYLSEQLEQPQLNIERPAAGTYFIRVRATDADGYVGAFSATQKLTILARWISSNGEPVQSAGGVIRPNF